MADVMKVFQPNKYYSIFIDNGVRPDGRQLGAFGLTSIHVNCVNVANGSALVHMRDTDVLCGIKAALVNPKAEEPRKGYIVPNVDFPPICSRRFMPGPPSEQAQIYTQLMANLLRDNSIIDLEKLCVTEGKLCWCLYIDMTCMNYSGNVLDACVLAMIAAAKTTNLPEVSTENDAIEILETKIPLTVNELVFSSTFAVFENGTVADPTLEEETLASSLVSVFIKDNRMIANVHFGRGGPVSEECMKHCVYQSKKRSEKLASLVKDIQTCNQN